MLAADFGKISYFHHLEMVPDFYATSHVNLLSTQARGMGVGGFLTTHQKGSFDHFRLVKTKRAV